MKRSKLNILKNVFLLSVLGVISRNIEAQSLDVSIINAGNNLIQVNATANGNFVAANGTDDWGTSVVTFRLRDLMSNYPITASAPSPNNDATAEDNTDFAGVTLVGQFTANTNFTT